jgi:8-oxo-dGTP pyrophosphatase MutT (NUDIX family)
VINAVIQRKSDGKFLFTKWKKFGWISPVVGGIDEGELPLETAEREVLEETGYTTKAIKTIGRVSEGNFFAENKNVWRQKITHDVVLELIDETPRSVTEEEPTIQEPIWLTYEEALEQVTHKDNLAGIKAFVEGETAFCEK